jgi:hypothetical protein
MTPLSGLDAAFLYLESEAMPMHVGSLQVYELPRGRRGDFFARARRHLAGRLHLTPVFRRRLATLPFDLASPMWVETGRSTSTITCSASSCRRPHWPRWRPR